MRRIFSNPLTVLAAGACLRLLFVLRFPAGAGDTVLYEQLATYWLKIHTYAMSVGGAPVAVDIRMPGYPAFLALVYALTGRTAENARLEVMLAQVVVDLGTCLLVGALAAVIANICGGAADRRRAFLAGLWISALCPLTANYVAVPLTEVWAVFLTALAFLLLALLVSRLEGITLPTEFMANLPNLSPARLAGFAGVAVGFGTLFRPEAPLLLVAAWIVLGIWLVRRREFGRWLALCLVMGCAWAIPVLPWAVRNAVTFHEFQPLAPKDANLPGELVPAGFMAWERTWLYRVRDNYLVPWKLNDDVINLDDIPPAAFDTPEEKERVAAILETYNEDLTLTREEDLAFAQLARERTARHPLRTYLGIPARRALRLWFTPRIELIPVSGNVFPLAYMHEEDPVDQRVTVFYFVLNILYALLGLWGAGKFWRCRGARPVLLVLLAYILLRTAFLTTLEAAEPRYTLVCFPAILALGAGVFLKRTTSA